MSADNFSLEVLIRSIKELRNVELARHLRDALRTQDLGMDAGIISDLIEELENDIEEHIARLERICGVLTPSERQQPESMNHERQQEVAWQAKCDLDEVESLCEAFAKAREILGSMGGAERQNLDLRVLFSNMGGMFGIDGEAVKDSGEGVAFTPQFLQKLLQKGLASQRADASRKVSGNDPSDLTAFEAQFEMDSPAVPKNRLPKDWRMK